MRRSSIWLRLFALLALIPLVAPMSAQAAFCMAHPSGMKCCMKVPAKAAPEVRSCCAEKSTPVVAPESGPTIGSDDGCKCSVGTFPKQFANESVLTPGAQAPAEVENACDLPKPMWFEPEDTSRLAPQTFFTDSSPPIDGHCCASFGRAPPVPVA